MEALTGHLLECPVNVTMRYNHFKFLMSRVSVHRLHYRCIIESRKLLINNSKAVVCWTFETWVGKNAREQARPIEKKVRQRGPNHRGGSCATSSSLSREGAHPRLRTPSGYLPGVTYILPFQGNRLFEANFHIYSQIIHWKFEFKFFHLNDSLEWQLMGN